MIHSNHVNTNICSPLWQCSKVSSEIKYENVKIALMEVIYSELETVGLDWICYEVPYILIDMFSQIMGTLLNQLNSDLQVTHWG